MTDPISEPSTPVRPPSRGLARSWRARVAQAAIDDAQRADDPEALDSARRVIDRGLLGAGLAFAILTLLGAIAGWTATAELLRPPDIPVHAPAMLLVLVGTPWLLLALRAVVLMILGRRAMPVLGRLVPSSFLQAIGRWRPTDAEASIVQAALRRVGQVFANGSGRRVAAAGSGMFWTAFAVAAILTVWLTTARVALGFGWESSWLSPRVGQTITDLAAAPLAPLIGSEELHPVASPPEAAADDETALAARRRWIRFLTAGLAVYLLAPMFLWTVANAAIGHWLAERWRPPPRPVPASVRRATASAANATPRPTPAATATASRSTWPSADGIVATHVVRLEAPNDRPALPPELAGLADLGELDSTESLDRVIATTSDPEAAVVVVSWIPATPDRGVRRRLRELAERSAHPPRLVLDGGDRLRRSESAATSAIRLEDWRAVSRDLGLAMVEVDLEHRTAESGRLLAAIVHGPGHERMSEPGTTPERTARLDPSRFDAALAVIGHRLDADTDRLPSDAGHAAAVRELVRELSGDDSTADRLGSWFTRIGSRGGLDVTGEAARAAALARTGLELLPASLRTGAVWAGLGGVLGASACIAAATIAPATLVAMPGWIGSGAGLAGLLSLTRRRRDGDPDAKTSTQESDETESPRLDDRVPALVSMAVLWWAQGGDEARTTRLLHAVLPGDTLPSLPDADAARRWLAAARHRVVSAMEDEA